MRARASSPCPAVTRWLGQTWQEAGAAEVREETGVAVDAAALRVVGVETTPDRRQNLIFCQSPPVEHEGGFSHDAEVSEVLVVHEPLDTAFPLHTRAVTRFFAARAPGSGLTHSAEPLRRFAGSMRCIFWQAALTMRRSGR